jgi:hypothetical protein
MFTCARCAAPLENSRQRCKVCSEKKAPSLPTLQGFGEEVDELGLKTLLTPRSEAELKYFDQHAQNTDPLGSPIPAFPQSQRNDLDSFGSSDSTEILNRIDDRFEDEGEDQLDMTITEGDELSITDDLKQGVLPLDSSSFPSSSPPPIPPPSQSIGGAKWRGVYNPFTGTDQRQVKPSFVSLWFNHARPVDRQRLMQGNILLVPNTNKKVAKVLLSDTHFRFEDSLNQEIWRPVMGKTEVTKHHTLRSGSLIMRLTEMTIDETEVLSQPSVAIWELKPTQEQVFYGAFNLFSGISRVGGVGCEIVLPFVNTHGPIFTLDSDLNGVLWCMSHSGYELWSLVREDDLIPYGNVLATQGKLFTLLRTLK